MRSRRWSRLTCTTLSALAATGCGTDGQNHDALERALLETSVGICDGDCRTFAAREVSCAAESHAHGGLAFRLCRVEYASRDRRYSETVCAAVDAGGKEHARPKSYCR